MVCRGYLQFVSGEEHLWSEFIYYMEKTEDGFAMSNDQERRAPSVCRSMYMCMEEIDRERAQSGWNPYAGEEEPDKKTLVAAAGNFKYRHKAGKVKCSSAISGAGSGSADAAGAGI